MRKRVALMACSIVSLLGGACDGGSGGARQPRDGGAGDSASPTACTPSSVVASGTLDGSALHQSYSWQATGYEGLSPSSSYRVKLQFGGNGLLLMDSPSPTMYPQFGARLPIGPVSSAWLMLPSDDPRGNNVYCFQEGGYDFDSTRPNDSITANTISARGIAMLAACPGGGTAVPGSITAGANDLSGTIDGLTFGATSGWEILVAAGAPVGVILRLDGSQIYAVLRFQGPSTTSTHAATGLIVTTKDSPGQGAIYCARSGNAVTSSEGLVSAGLRDFARLGTCDDVSGTDALDFGCL